MVGEVLRPRVLVLPKFLDADVTAVTGDGEAAHFFMKSSDTTVKFKKVAAAIENVAYT
jgi:hypothetical protein